MVIILVLDVVKADVDTRRIRKQEDGKKVDETQKMTRTRKNVKNIAKVGSESDKVAIISSTLPTQMCNSLDKMNERDIGSLRPFE